ncbi:MAG: benzoate-CoA ligase family protein [Alphaproteobacteria bacterium]|nr:benzoate-CoA ligase family protein [Alphaproteobacteria bacterium]
MGAYTAHRDTFARDNLPPANQLPDFLLGEPPFDYPEKLNCIEELLDKAVTRGWGDRPCLIAPAMRWTYAELKAQTDRIAHVLIEDLGLQPGNRVLLRAANNPMMVACWFAVAKAGGIVVATMPLLRAQELSVIIDKAEIDLALCDERLMAEMTGAQRLSPRLKRICLFNGETGGAELEGLTAAKPDHFDPVPTASDDVVLIAFTSGTTGKPKGTMHFHRDIIAICDAVPAHCLQVKQSDVFIGSPPLAFTFGLGGLVLFPMRYGASTVLLEKATPPALLDAIPTYGATTLFTAPTAYRAIMTAIEEAAPHRDDALASLHSCVSAGETLPSATFEAWKRMTGIACVDGLGSTELLHIFIAAPADQMRAGATGKPIPGYEARVVDDAMKDLPPGEVGKLAVRGPTGCRYLADDRQTVYVRDGWNLTGDAYWVDEDGYFHFAARADDMIISAGYNIAGPEVEDCLLGHAAVAECAVIGAPDEERGTIVKAYIVLRAGHNPGTALTDALQDWVKQRIAPYKYPRAIEFVDALPKTETGKVQRFKLRGD